MRHMVLFFFGGGGGADYTIISVSAILGLELISPFFNLFVVIWLQMIHADIIHMITPLKDATKVQILADHLYFLTQFNMQIVDTSGQSRFQPS